MGSRRQEERNEKIIRGLMKLPPNRRCINCNSLGPQYVCTNFRTFVCMACSGIHREFTHRVKSVSMAKFTSQEVEALQNGGNQRAREIYLKNWDHQRQRLPDSSNADKVRDFIKGVYVEKKYAGENPSDKPPRDSQIHRNSEDVTRRASSYHSYSQSPPYDYQYEERRYGKQASGFTSKSGSERGHHVKASSFVYSPGRFSDHIFEDRFANEVFAPRASDFSVSSGGDPFRSETQSPNFQKDVGFSSPEFQHSKVLSSENIQHQTTIFSPDGQHQRTTSFGSVRSFDSNSLSSKSYNSSSLADAVPENDQSAGIHQHKTSTPASSATYGGLDLFSAPVAPEADSTMSPSIDLFRLPEAPAAQAVNTFLPSTGAQPLPANLCQSPHTYPPPSMDFFAGILDQQPTSKPPEFSVPKNEGWATFDSPLSAGKPSAENITSGFPRLDNSSVKTDGFSNFDTSMQWPEYQNSNSNQLASSIPGPWHDDLSGIPDTVVPTGNRPWNAFLNSIKDNPLENNERLGESTGETSKPSSNIDQQHLGLRVAEDSSNDGPQRAKIVDDATDFGFPGDICMAPSYPPPMIPVTEEAWLHVNNHKSTNPFDFPYDLELEPTDMFLDMSSLQAALPNIQPPSNFIADASQPRFSADAAALYVSASAGAQGGLAYTGGQASTSQLQNLPAQDPVASIGGNPFA